MYNSQNISKRIKERAQQQGIALGQMLSSCDILTQNFAKIANCLDCSVDYLLGRTDNPEINK